MRTQHSEPDARGQAKTVLILVHGTFADNYGWVADPYVHEALRSSLAHADVDDRFQWSGRNSHQARLEGAAELLAHILQYPAWQQIVIVAHSHGGNVATYAERANTDLWQSRVRAIVAIGTPWLSARPRSLEFLGAFLSFVAITSITSIALALNFGMPSVSVHLFSQGSGLGGVALMAASSLAIFLLIWLLLSDGKRVSALRKRIRERLSAMHDHWTKEQSTFTKSVETNRPHYRTSQRTHPRLVIATPGDEARAWLKFITWVGNIPHWLFSRWPLSCLIILAFLAPTTWEIAQSWTTIPPEHVDWYREAIRTERASATADGRPLPAELLPFIRTISCVALALLTLPLSLIALAVFTQGIAAVLGRYLSGGILGFGQSSGPRFIHWSCAVSVYDRPACTKTTFRQCNSAPRRFPRIGILRHSWPLTQRNELEFISKWISRICRGHQPSRSKRFRLTTPNRGYARRGAGKVVRRRS